MTAALVKPRKKFKDGTTVKRADRINVSELDITQWSLERLHGVLEKLVISNNEQGKQLKEAQIQLGIQAMTLKRLQQRVERTDSE